MKDRIPLGKETIFKNRYRIIDLLGKGGMGNVYKAFDEKDKAFVALKETFADEEDTRRAFRHEAKILEDLSHQAFPQVFDFFADENELYLVMELIEGSDLKDLLELRGKPFEIGDVLEWTRQILNALEVLHSRGIVHRDIKPSNLILTPGGIIKILDFGIAKGVASDMTTFRATDTSSIAAASKTYAPLEQVLRADPHSLQMLSVAFSEKTERVFAEGTDARSDIYALGATVYELLTRLKPVSSPIRALIVWSGQTDKLTAPHEQNKDVSQSLSAAIQKAMEIDRENRFNSAAEMRQALGATDDSIRFLSLGIECLEKTDYDGAIKHCTKAIELNPAYSEAYTNRGIANAALRNLEAAIADYNQAIELDPESFYGFINRGKLYSDREDYERAINDYDKAVGLNPQMAVAYYNRANAYSRVKDFQKAIADYSRAIELNPAYEAAYNNRGLAYSEVGDDDSAKEDLIMYLKCSG